VWGDRVFTVSARLDGQDRVLLCLDRGTGKILWHKTELQAPLEKKHSLNSYASSTPATDGEQFQLIAKNELGEKCFASPAISEQQIFIRSDKHLFCIGQPRQ